MSGFPMVFSPREVDKHNFCVDVTNHQATYLVNFSVESKHRFILLFLLNSVINYHIINAGALET